MASFISRMAQLWPRHLREWLLKAIKLPLMVSLRDFVMTSSALWPHRSGTKSRALGPQTCGSVWTPGAFQPTHVPAGISMASASRDGCNETRLMSCETGGYTRRSSITTAVRYGSLLTVSAVGVVTPVAKTSALNLSWISCGGDQHLNVCLSREDPLTWFFPSCQNIEFISC